MISAEDACIHDKVRAEAMRAIPGMMAAQDRGCVPDAAKLMDAYHRSAAALGVEGQMAWSILFTACLHWLKEMCRNHAAAEDVDVAAVYQKMGSVAALWVSDRQGVGGY